MGKRYDILRLDPQDKPIFFVVEAFSPDGDPSSTAFYYDENTCPTNIFVRGVEEIIVDGDTDRHGLFEFVRTTESLDFLERTHCPEDEWPKVIPEAFTKTP